MRRSVLTLALAALCGFGVSTVLAHAGDPAAAVGVKAEAKDTAPQSRMEAREAMDGAVAAAVIGAVSQQFGEQQIEVKLDSVAVRPASLRDRNVSGEGRLRLGKDAPWIPFQYATLYDTTTTSVSYPRLVLGADASATTARADARIERSLWSAMDGLLRGEFQNQPLQLKLANVRQDVGAGRYVRVRADADVDFGREGSTVAAVDGLYDRTAARWVRVNYELSTAEATAGSGLVATAY